MKWTPFGTATDTLTALIRYPVVWLICIIYDAQNPDLVRLLKLFWYAGWIYKTVTDAFPALIRYPIMWVICIIYDAQNAQNSDLLAIPQNNQGGIHTLENWEVQFCSFTLVFLIGIPTKNQRGIHTLENRKVQFHVFFVSFWFSLLKIPHKNQVENRRVQMYVIFAFFWFSLLGVPQKNKGEIHSLEKRTV